MDRDKKRNEEKTDTQSKKEKIYDHVIKVGIATTFLAVIFLVVIEILSRIDSSFSYNISITWKNVLPMLANLIAILATFFGIVVSIFKIAKNAETDSETKLEKKQEKYLEQVQKLEGDKELPDRDALELIKVNLANINEYYIWSQKQAKSAFNAAIATCSVGFLLVVAAVLIPIVKQDFNSTISFISFLGGAITEVIGGTIFFVYRKSLTQLNYYHKALHEDQRFLSSVNLIKKFHDENMGDEMLKEIIQSAIDINRAEFSHPKEGKADKNKSDT